MWELKNLSNKDYTDGFKDGAGFAAVVILAVALVLMIVVGIVEYVVFYR